MAASCSFDLLYGGLGISQLQFLIKFSVIKTLDPDPDRYGTQPKMLDPDSMNLDPKNCL
jgi:hypothetical protein